MEAILRFFANFSYVKFNTVKPRFTKTRLTRVLLRTCGVAPGERKPLHFPYIQPA